jgi:putative ATP-dependent endonuclease of the OLD family
MRLKALILENFRGYKGTSRIDIEDLTAFIGKNDAGKSSALEALEIFFNSDQVKLERADLCAYSDTNKIRIGCIFSEFPSSLIIDSRASTTLADEYLLNKDGDLEIHKIFDCSLKTPKELVCAIAEHPTGEDLEDLLLRKNDELKSIFKKLGIAGKDIDLRSNVQIRRAIRKGKEPFSLKTTEIPLDKEDAKKIWDQMKPHMPVFALFRSDRPSQDADDEVQNPLKFAVSEAIKQLEPDISKIEAEVRAKADDVAQRTLEKLKEMDAALAAELKPDFKADRKWDSLFKFTLTSDDNIPINKRGSGVRRLILLNFFRAEAERRQAEKQAPSVIYAIEEPETSQHPHNQRLLVDAFSELSEQKDTQVVLTTHTPGLAGLLPHAALRYIHRAADKSVVIDRGTDTVLHRIATELGVLPDRRVNLVLFLEGPNDIEMIRNLSAILRAQNNEIISLQDDNRIAAIPLGGGNLKQWVENHYLKGIGLPEVHIYDRDAENPPKYESACQKVNDRKDGSWAVLTNKREIENYLHPEAIKETHDVDVSFDEDDDVPLIVAKAVHEKAPDSKPWDEIGEEAKKKKIRHAKHRLCRDTAAKMTGDRLKFTDPDAEIEGWLRRIATML